MLAYYDQRAPEYEEAFTLGTGTSSIQDPEVFKADARVLPGIVRRFARGRIMDLACGTAFWLPEYAPGCSHITLFDQSDRMLMEARGKVKARCLRHGARRLPAQPSHRGARARLVRRPPDNAWHRWPIPHSGFGMEPRAGGGQPQGRTPATTSERRDHVRHLQTVLRSRRQARWSTEYGAELQLEHFGPAFYAVSGTFAEP